MASSADTELARLSLAWWPVVTAVTVAGLVLLPLTERQTPPLPGAVTAAVVVVIVSACLRRSEGATRAREVVLILRDGPLGLVFCLALQGWIGLVGPVALVGLLALAACSPPVASRLRRRHRRAGPASAASTSQEEVSDGRTPVALLMRPEQIASMPTADIGAAWRRTGLELPHIRDPGARARLVELRRRYLDELERRDHDAPRWWLAQRPRATRDPTCFFGSSWGPPDSLAS